MSINQLDEAAFAARVLESLNNGLENADEEFKRHIKARDALFLALDLCKYDADFEEAMAEADKNDEGHVLFRRLCEVIREWFNTLEPQSTELRLAKAEAALDAIIRGFPMHPDNIADQQKARYSKWAYDIAKAARQ